MSKSLPRYVHHPDLLGSVVTDGQARAFEIDAMEKAMKAARYSNCV